jgi:hypothetical protein
MIQKQLRFQLIMLLYKSVFYTTSKTLLQSPNHNPNESKVCLSASLTVFPSVVLPSVASHYFPTASTSHYFPTASTPCSLANYEAGTRQQHLCIIQRVCQSPIDRHCILFGLFLLQLQEGFLRKNLRTPLEL